MTAIGADAVLPVARVSATGAGQRVAWLVFDAGLALLVLIVAGDIPNRWGISSLLWMVIYAAAFLRILSVWPAFFRLLARNWTYLLYPVICLLSVIWSIERGTTIVAGVQMTMTVLIACFIGWRFDPRRLILMAFASVMAGSTLSMVNYISGGALARPLFSAVGGLLGIYTNKNMLGHYSAMATLLGMTLLLAPRYQVPRLARRAAALAVIICPIAVVLSKSMTAILLLPVFMGLTLLLNRRRLAGWIRYGAIALIVLGIALIPAGLTLAGIDPMAELFALTGKDANLTGRTDLWAIAATEIGHVPLTGYGFRAFWVADRFETARFLVLRAGATAPGFHNVFADVGIGTGLFGIAAILTLLLTTLRRVFRVWRFDGSALSVGCLVTVLMPLGFALVEPYLYRPHELMLSWVIMLGVSLGNFPRGPHPLHDRSI